MEFDSPVAVRFEGIQAAIDLLVEQIADLRRQLAEPRQGNGNRAAPHHSGKVEVRRSTQGCLVVEVDGVRLKGQCGADVFADAIAAIGVDRTMRLGIRRGSYPLVSSTNPPTDRGYRTRDGHFVLTHSSSAEKLRTLNEIAARLRISIRAWVV